ncbi:MAG: TonB-dependent receptor plug domain-containing protein [Bacteroidales bacterium]|nr:TonB-dependent receptor plug domain-containing protein [Bacteroidales bacterium]
MKKSYPNLFPPGRNLNLLTKMKLILVFLTVVQLTLAANSQASFNIILKDATLETILKEVTIQSDYEFFFAHEELASTGKISLNVENASIEEVLQKCLENTNLDYELIDNVIVIKHVGESVITEPEYQEKKIRITGTVTGKEDGLPMPWVTVVIKGTTQGVTTDNNGIYVIDVPDENSVLAFSSIGFLTQEIAIGSRTTIDIVLNSSVTNLGEVIITAIGTTVKVDETGSTSSIVRSEMIGKSGEAGVINSIAGKASGVKITKSNGDPGSGSSIQIRGSNTIEGASQPLIILDGIPVSNDNIGEVTISQQSRLDDINPKDIESVQILKGASAAALWGSRAANGVIVITTKMGKINQKPRVQYAYTQSFDMVSVREPIQDKYGQGRNGVWSSTDGESWGDKIANRSGAPDVVNESGAYFTANTTGNKYYQITQKNSRETFLESNWDQVFQTGVFGQHTISIDGGR